MAVNLLQATQAFQQSCGANAEQMRRKSTLPLLEHFETVST